MRYIAWDGTIFFLSRCGGEGHISKDCTEEMKTRVIESEDGTKREIYVPREMEDDKLFDQGIGSGINFDKFDHIPVRKKNYAGWPGHPGYVNSCICYK